MRRHDAYYVLLRRRRGPAILGLICAIVTIVATMNLHFNFVLAAVCGAIVGWLVYRLANR